MTVACALAAGQEWVANQCPPLAMGRLFAEGGG